MRRFLEIGSLRPSRIKVGNRSGRKIVERGGGRSSVVLLEGVRFGLDVGKDHTTLFIYIKIYTLLGP